MNDGVKTALNGARASHQLTVGDRLRQDAARQADLFQSRTELDQAIDQAKSDDAIVEAAWRQAEAEAQRDAELGGTAELGGGDRRPGRPKGARNLRTEEAARFYIRRHGDPLEQAVKLGAIPILAKGVLEALAQRLGCSKLDAAKFWASNNQAVMPFIRPRLGSLELLAPGSPESTEAVTWEHWDYIDGELIDTTVSEQRSIEAQQTAETLPDPGEPGQ